MANIVYHELYCEGIKQKLMDAGVICEKTLTSKSYPKGKVLPHVLDYSKCNREEWEDEKERILKDGIVDYGKRNEKGECGVRRDYTPEEQSELGYYPVQFSEDGNKMIWFCRYIPNEDISFYASSALPNEVMILHESCEGDYYGGCYLKNGNNFANKPVARLIGAAGNIFNLTGIASRALRESGLCEQAEQMQKRVASCKSYEEAIAVIVDYVETEETEEKN